LCSGGYGELSNLLVGVPLVGAALAWIGCLVLWLTQPRGKDHKEAAAE
jgi:hypothetical protein